jgi:GntR family transcriptional regulator
VNVRAEPELTLQGGVGIYCQIQTQIRDHIVSGQLLPGEQLPTVREMAVGLSVNPDAVSRAYRELEREGFLTSEEGSGTFVTGQPVAPIQQEEFERLCDDFLAQAARHGFSSIDVIDAIEMLAQRRLSS